MATSVLEFLITAKDEASDKLKNISNIAPQIGTAFTVAGGAITGALALAVKAAADAQEKMAQFNTVVANTPGITKATTDALLRASDATIKLGFDNEETAVSLAQFYRQTKSVEEATKLNSTAMDIARAKNISLADAHKAINLILAGSTKELKAMGIEVDANATAQENLTKVTDAYAGSAQRFSDTFKGQIQVFQQSFGELEETIGTVLLPLLTELAKKAIVVINYIREWTEAHPQLTRFIVIAAAAVGSLLVVLGPLILFLTALSPLMLLIVGVGAGIVAFFVLLGVVMYNVYQITLQFIEYSRKVWPEIKAVVKDAVEGIVAFFQPLVNILQTIIDLASRVGNAISGAMKGAAAGPVASAVLGKRALGGSVRGDSSYIVGENGPEVFTPGNSGYVSSNGSLAGAGNITVNVNGGYYLDQRAALDMGNMIVQQLKRVSKIGL